MRSVANRRLVPIEQSKEVLNRYMGGTNVLLASRIRGPLTEALVRGGLDLLQRRHPRLRSIIEGPNHALRFRDERAGPIPLRVERYRDDADCRRAEMEELGARIDSGTCLLRAALLLPEDGGDASYLLLLAHHAIADGSALVEMVEDLMGYCRRLQEGDPPGPGEVISRPMPPSVEALMPASYRGLRGAVKCRAHVRRMRATLRTFGARTLPIEEDAPLRSRTTGTVRITLDEEQVRRIRDACREVGASLHGLLCAAVLFAAAGRLRDDGPEIPVCCRSSVSLRQKVVPPLNRKDVSLVASFLFSFHRIRPETTLWDVAGEVLEQLWQGYRNGDMFKGLVGNRGNSMAAARGRAPVTVFVTNLDEPPIATRQGPFHIEEIAGLPASAPFAGVLGLGAMIINGRMMLVFFYSKPSISDASVEALARDTAAWLERAGTGGPAAFGAGTSATEA